MPTEQKTSLGLNRWQGTDKPARADFVADNETLDSLLAEHFGDTRRICPTKTACCWGMRRRWEPTMETGPRAGRSPSRLRQRLCWFSRWTRRQSNPIRGTIG